MILRCQSIQNEQKARAASVIFKILFLLVPVGVSRRYVQLGRISGLPTSTLRIVQIDCDGPVKRALRLISDVSKIRVQRQVKVHEMTDT
jgi:hypothetical protein